MITETNTANLQQNLQNLLDRVRYQNDTVIIKNNDEPIVAIVDASLLARLQGDWRHFDRAAEKLRAAYKDIPEDEGIAQINEICAEVRKEMRG